MHCFQSVSSALVSFLDAAFFHKIQISGFQVKLYWIAFLISLLSFSMAWADYHLDFSIFEAYGYKKVFYLFYPCLF